MAPRCTSTRTCAPGKGTAHRRGVSDDVPQWVSHIPAGQLVQLRDGGLHARMSECQVDVLAVQGAGELDQQPGATLEDPRAVQHVEDASQNR